MLRTLAAAAVCTAMFAAGAEAATNRITANGITVTAEGVFASGGAYEVPIGSAVTLDLTVDEFSVYREPTFGDISGFATGPGGSGIATSGGGVVLDVTSVESWSQILSHVTVDAAFSADLGGVIAPGFYHMIGFGVGIEASGPGTQRLNAALILFTPEDAFDGWTSLADLSLGSVSALLWFNYMSSVNVPGSDTSINVDDYAFASVTDFSIAPVPLPAAAPLLIAGLAGLGFAGRRRLRP